MNILFTICGRKGSKGIKNKNISNFLGLPLPYYTLSIIDLYIKKHKIDFDIALNTDSLELVNLVKKVKLDNIYFIERIDSLSGDRASKIDVIADTYLKMNKEYDMVIDLDITSPLRKLEDLENLIEEKTRKNYDVVFSVANSRRNPYFNMVKANGDYFERVITSNFTSRQEAPEIYDMNASLYAYEPKFLTRKLGIFDGKCGIIKMYDTGILDLDHKEDLELMSVIANYLFETNSKFNEVRENIKKII